MLLRKSIITTLATIGISSMCVLAHAEDLTVTNNTAVDSTSIVTNGKNECSIKYGEDGITRAGAVNHIIHTNIIRIACGAHLSDCYANIYMSSNCSGDPVATVEYNLKDNKGIIHITSLSSSYQVTGSGFKLTLASNPV